MRIEEYQLKQTMESREFIESIKIVFFLAEEIGRFVPNGRSLLLFHYKLNETGKKRTYHFKDIYCTGGFIYRNDNTLEEGDIFIEIEMYTPYLSFLLSESASQIVGSILPLSFFNTALFHELKMAEEQNDIFALARCLEKTICIKLAQLPHPHKEMLSIINTFHLSDPGHSIERIVNECGKSRRTIERSFREFIGISPKNYTRIIRFYNSYSFLRNNPQVPYTDLAQMFGFYDQSHMINEYRKIAGLLPHTVNPMYFTLVQ